MTNILHSCKHKTKINNFQAASFWLDAEKTRPGLVLHKNEVFRLTNDSLSAKFETSKNWDNIYIYKSKHSSLTNF